MGLHWISDRTNFSIFFKSNSKLKLGRSTGIQNCRVKSNKLEQYFNKQFKQNQSIFNQVYRLFKI